LITNIQLAQRFVEAISRKSLAELSIKSWDAYLVHKNQPASTGQPVRPAILAAS